MPPDSAVALPPWAETFLGKLADAVASAVQSKATSTRLPLLLDRAAAAEFVGLSLSTWDRLTAGHGCPEPVQLHGPRWRTSDLQAWAAYGCPNRSDFEVLARKKRAG